jgi:hypothetical protein
LQLVGRDTQERGNARDFMKRRSFDPTELPALDAAGADPDEGGETGARVPGRFAALYPSDLMPEGNFCPSVVLQCIYCYSPSPRIH